MDFLRMLALAAVHSQGVAAGDEQWTSMARRREAASIRRPWEIQIWA